MIITGELSRPSAGNEPSAESERTATKRGRKRRAVVLIHGIGEQRPMDTLRGFVTAVSGDDYYGTPDPFASTLELRRFTPKSDSQRQRTDFFEFYWAHHFPRGRWTDSLRWVSSLVFKTPFFRAPRSIRSIAAVIQVAPFLSAIIAWVAVANSKLDIAIPLLSILVLAAIASVAVGRFFTGPLSEAFRYLTPHPWNILDRQAVRADGLALLRHLHEDGRYDQVVIVAHSLGSVIGLDLIRLLWSEMRLPTLIADGTQQAAESFLSNSLPEEPSPAQAVEFQKRQYELFAENRRRGVPWLVTDFITLGSPLTYASMLLDSRDITLRQRQHEREYPRCPPPEGSIYWKTMSIGEDTRTLLVGDVGAAFGPTRWTNLYFPVKWLRGDPVGGPLRQVFGAGVRDIAVRLPAGGTRQWCRGLLLRPHTRYWYRQDPSHGRKERLGVDRGDDTKESMQALKNALALDFSAAKAGNLSVGASQSEQGHARS